MAHLLTEKSVMNEQVEITHTESGCSRVTLKTN